MSYIKHKNLNDRAGQPAHLITLEYGFPAGNKFYTRHVVTIYRWNEYGVGQRAEKAVFDTFSMAHKFYDELTEEYFQSVETLDL